MNRILLCLVIALGYAAVRGKPLSPVAPLIPGIGDRFASVSSADRKALSETYGIISKTIAANPADEPVFADIADVRRAHRAALLSVWRGVLGNQPGKYPGLREALESYVDQQLGSADVPLSPQVQQQAVTAFQKLSDSLK
jgi:hypothetical protein